jgi:arylsulfatase
LDKLRNNHYERATSLNDRAVDWLDASDEPSFLWAHYMDAHGPYEPPAEFQRLFREEAVAPGRAQDLYHTAVTEDDCSAAERRTLIDLYDAEIRYLDAALDSLFERLDAAGVLETSLVIITADHGDAFGEHGYYGHPRYLHDELIHVPLLALGPGVPSTTIDVPVSTLDVVPTILDSLNVDCGADLPGLSLFDVLDDPTAFEDRVVFSQARSETSPTVRRFGIQGGSIGGHLERDISSGTILTESVSNQDAARALRSHSADRFGIDSQQVDTDGPPTSIQHRLEALGYLED